MALAVSMFAVSCVSIVIFTALNLKIRIKKLTLHLYWMIPAVCAIVLLATGSVPWSQFGAHLVSASSMNPLKVLALFLSMSAMSVFLDQAGLFRWLASRALKRASTSQIKLFLILYFVIAAVTLVTSNATIVLTFTPFICYFAKHSGINPVPYLFAEFVSANTWCMFLLIGNATNTYIASAFNISFVQYLSVMAIPTVFAAIVSLATLLIMFRKQLKEPLNVTELVVEVKNKPALAVGVAGMATCIVLLMISTYIGVEMWMAALICAGAVIIAGSICYVAKRQSLHKVFKTFGRMPWHLVPFLLSMYVVVMSLSNTGITDTVSAVFQNGFAMPISGVLSALVSNVMGNIPMSILFSDMLTSLEGKALFGSIFATIIGSSIGNLITPISSMSAIMFRSIIRRKKVDFSFWTFVRKGVIIAIPTLVAALGGLALVMLIMPV